jgi:hypothetical protein
MLVAQMALSVAILIIWVMAVFWLLSGAVRRGGWLLLTVACLHIVYGGYLIVTG